MPPQYLNRSEDEIELQSTKDANFRNVAVVSKPRPPDQFLGGRLFDDNLLFEAHTPLAQLEQNVPLLLPRDDEDSEEVEPEVE